MWCCDAGDELLNSQATDRFEFRSTWRKKRSDVPHRGLAEEAAIFAIELCRAFVADLKGRAGRIETIVQHQAPRRLKPQLFLILQRTHRGQHPEMMVQR